MTKFRHLRIAGVLGTFVAMAFSGGASADPFTFFNQPNVAQPSPPAQTSAYADSADEEAEVAAEFRRQTVDYRSSEAPGTIIIDPRTPISTSCWAAVKRCGTGSASGAKASPGPGRKRSNARASGRTGRLPPR